MRSFETAIAFVTVCSLTLGVGCATVEPIHRPPTPGELERVNATHPVMVELLGPRPSLRADHIVSADVAKIVVAPETGPPYALPLDDVFRFTVNRVGRGAAIGAGVGAAVCSFFILGLLPFEIGMSGNRPPNSHPESGVVVAQDLAAAVLVSAAVGALIGAATGSRHLFPVNLSPDPPPPSCRTSQPGQRSASVVAPFAEVHSAPFNVAPVVEVLPAGQRLFVDASPNAGWRFAKLWDCRVGYVEDAHVKMDTP